MNKYIKLFMVLPLLMFSFIGSALDNNPSKRKKANSTQATKVMGCGPATTTRNMVFNNVRSLIETGGSLWQDRSNGNAAYIVPKNQDVAVIYAGALWMGGKSPDQQLKLAAVRYRTVGEDFWPGPLSSGSAETNSETCQAYDKMFISYKIDAERHSAWANATINNIGETPVGYVTPGYFDDYPAHGNVSLGQAYHLAPFYDFNGDDFYDPADGDYPWYDVLSEYDCRKAGRLDEVPLFGDETYYWIFNDKGNIHSETQGDPIGMEIRAQAFSFATTDEINNMTFYNYTLINQGSQTLTQTYFGQYADPDVGNAANDYVGCDVGRGLGYCYNGTDTDPTGGGVKGWGDNPPAVGIDFFEGPYQDSDEEDNPKQPNITIALDSAGIPYSGLGVGYGDGIIDNERFGMRKFIYYNISGTGTNDPDIAPEYYNYMTGFWKDGAPLTFGGNGHDSNSGVPCDYMFPGDSDPLRWGTLGADGGNDNWSEFGEDNPPGDRRFIQSAGPFTLEPGQWNNITVGVVYGRAFTGNSFESVKQVLAADDKAQALFDACFELIPGPNAPDLSVLELENKLVLTITNESFISNNQDEVKYDAELFGFDPGIPEVVDGVSLSDRDRSYLFQGYQIYQLADETISASDLSDPEKARLVFQCDKEDGIGRILNYNVDLNLDNAIVPTEQVNGGDEGILHSFEVTTDAFSTGSPLLVNFKSYYFMAVAYAHNKYADYEYQTGSVDASGQDIQYLGSDKSSTGGNINAVVGIPHRTDAGLGVSSLDYGDGVEITQHEGVGNGVNILNISQATEDQIVTDYVVEALTYEAGAGPVNIKIIDPVRVQDIEFELKLVPETGDSDYDEDSTFWLLTDLTNNIEIDVFQHAFRDKNEYILAEYGLSMVFNRYEYDNPEFASSINSKYTSLLASSIEVANPSAAWYVGVEDEDGFSELNWIRSGVQESDETPPNPMNEYYDDVKIGSNALDSLQEFEDVLGGTWGPMYLTSRTDLSLAQDATTNTGAIAFVGPRVKRGSLWGTPSGTDDMIYMIGLNNVDIVFTNDKSKWTRSPVLEMQIYPELAEGGAEKMMLRAHASVDKNGLVVGEAGYNASEGASTGPTGMGWFPGYAIDLGTGERLNIAFGEDSWMEDDNGDDMLWNPTSTLRNNLGEPRAGGQHWIFIFKNAKYEQSNPEKHCPRYDKGQFIYSQFLDPDFGTSEMQNIFSSCTWVGSGLTASNQPLLSAENGIIPQETRIKLRVAKKYMKYSSTQIDSDNAVNSENDWNPLYTFSTKSASTINADVSNDDINNEILDAIQVVPNPYYAYSEYETGKLDNRVKLTNLPQECTITIYNVSGTLIRQFKKADPLSFLDWDLKNGRNIPISSGVYIIHVEVPDVGETVLKWFGVMRPVDLDNF